MSSNLLEHRAVRGLMKSRWYPGVFQAVTAAVFILIVFELLAGPSAASHNFGTALTWVVWWPLLPIMFVFLGRFWCTVCPFGALSDLVQKLVGNQEPVPAFLKRYGIWLIDAMFILITWSDHVFGVVESPWGSGVLLLTITTGVVISGALWQRRAFCRYLCFLGGLSGNYARTGMLSLRADQKVCANCKARAACFNGNEHGPGCPMFEFPRTMDSNARCTLCGSCVKTCPNDAIRLTLQPPTKELWFISKPRLEESFLAAVIMGIVFVQNITMLDVWQSLLADLERFTGTTSYAVNFTITFAIAMAIPVGLLMLAAVVGQRLNGESALQNFARFGYAIIPLDVAGHIAHNLFHLLAEGKAVGFTALELVGRQVDGSSTALVGTTTIHVLQFGLVALGVIASLLAARHIAKKHHGPGSAWTTFVPYAVAIGLFGSMNVWLFSLPMAMRM